MAKVKILIVEDEAITAKDLQNMLRGLGYDAPVIASSGEGAIKKAEEIKPDLVLMDIVLKGDMDGIEAAEQIRDRFDIPVVYVTAYLDEERLQKTKASAPYGYITKPFGDKDLRATIEMALQRHTLEKALRESEEKYRSLVTNLPDVTWTTDNEGNTTFSSPNIEKVYGYTSEEIYKAGDRLWFGRIYPDDVEKVNEAYKVLFEKKEKFDVEYRIKRKDGKWIWLHDRAIATYEKEGVLYANGIFADITERKQMEEKQRLFSHALDSSIDGLAMGDLEGRITYVNDAFVRMFGYSREELIGNEIGFMYSEDQLPKLEEALKATMAGGLIGELVGRRKNGELFPIAISSSLVKDDEGNVIAHMANHEDISERKRAENELKKKNKELELFNRLAVGRELKMIELKKEINALLVQLGKESKYKIVGES